MTTQQFSEGSQSKALGLNTILICLAIACIANLTQPSTRSDVAPQESDQLGSTVEQVQEFVPSQRGTPMRRQGGGSR